MLRAQAFTNPITNPVVISQILSHTGGDWVKTRHQSISRTGFQVKQEEDGLDIGHNTEVYGWIALSEGENSMGATKFEAIKTPDAVTHNPYTVSYTSTFSAVPAVFGSMQSFDGPHPAHLRPRCRRRPPSPLHSPPPSPPPSQPLSQPPLRLR